MRLVLYHGSISTCSQKVRLVLAEKGLAYEKVDVDVPAREHLTEAYLKLNPNGVVPTLVHDGRPVIDSSVICEYLDEVFPNPPLVPRDPVDRANMRAWMRYFEEVPTSAIRTPSYNRVLIRDFGAERSERLNDLRRRSPLRRHFYEDLGPEGFSDTAYARSIERLSDCVRRVNSALADGRAFLLGASPTIADFVLLPSAVRMADIGLAELWRDHPHLSAWFERMGKRPSFGQAYYAGCRLVPVETAPVL